MSESFFRTGLRDDGETEVEFEVAVNSWGCAAQTYGPPENCYPAEGMEVEIIDAWLLADADKADAPRITLTDAEHQRLCDEFCENPPEQDYPDYV